MECSNYLRCMAETGPSPEGIALLNKATAEATKDLEELINKWQKDMPILLAVVRGTIPFMEQIAGLKGVELADELGKVSATIMIRDKK